MRPLSTRARFVTTSVRMARGSADGLGGRGLIDGRGRCAKIIARRRRYVRTAEAGRGSGPCPRHRQHRAEQPREEIAGVLIERWRCRHKRVKLCVLVGCEHHATSLSSAAACSSILRSSIETGQFSSTAMAISSRGGADLVPRMSSEKWPAETPTLAANSRATQPVRWTAQRSESGSWWSGDRRSRTRGVLGGSVEGDSRSVGMERT